MNILITGSNGFIGKNLNEALKNIRDGKDKRFQNLMIDEIYTYDKDKSISDLDNYCFNADFVFNLAGVNRPPNNTEFMEGNHDFAIELLDVLKKHHNTCPIMLSSSIQANLKGRYKNSEYGSSKKAAEDLLFDYSIETNTKVLVYRFPNVFGKWCKPNYNSVVATFCSNIANNMPIKVNDPKVNIELLYIDDLIYEMLLALQGKEHRCDFNEDNLIPLKNGKFCYVPTVHYVELGKIVGLLYQFSSQPKTLLIPDIPNESFSKKLYSTYLSYLPENKISFPLKMNIDERGSFTELLKTKNNGQFSVNISKPGITKGEHWHNSKWEFFFVVSGHGMIQERKIGSNKIISFEVSGNKVEAVHMLPGYTHNIINLSKTENLITVMWANEMFDEKRPDTFSEKIIIR